MLMVIKLVKVLAVIIVVAVVILVLLYIFGPYLIKSRMAREKIETDPTKYEGLNALPENGTILFVTAHPDDLEFMAGGTLPKLIERKNNVYLAILTDGGKERYMPGFYSRAIIKTRHDEQLNIAKIEGLKKVFFINYKDGSLKYSEEAADKIENIAQDIGTTDIFAFEPGIRNGYYDSDHNAAGEIGTAVAKKDNAIKAVYYFRAVEPDVVIDITDTFERKIDILFMFSEFTNKKRLLRALHEAFAASDGKRIGVKYGEAFKKVDLSQVHVRAANADPTKEPMN